jgi:predicted nucleotidyltransferase
MKTKKNSKHIESIKQKILPIFKKYNVTKAGIFGSFARGNNKKKSDIDILAEIDKKYSLYDVIGMQLLLQKVLKKKVDLVEYELIRPEIKENILNDEIRII